MTDESLSEKIFYIDNGTSRGGITSRHQRRGKTEYKYQNRKRLLVKDVREFIKKLKEVLRKTYPNLETFGKSPIEIIDKLAGEDLI